MSRRKPILVTGATGYIGGRLIPVLLNGGYKVRAMARSLNKLEGRSWAGQPRMELVEGNALDPGSLSRAVSGCSAAFYLIHSMVAQRQNYAEADRRAAHHMVSAASEAGLERIIYLGGLAESKNSPLSKHLSSRIEVGRILQKGPVPTTTLRAPVILGSGSASFEILRYLVERLPIMITPRWVRSLNQPVAVRNVITYLTGCLEKPETSGRTFDIGGPDIITYQKLLEIYAQEARLPKRLIIPVPFLTPKLSAYWIHLISPVPAAIARPLVQGLTSNAVCTENRIREIIPQRLLTSREAIRLALDRLKQEKVETCWMDAGVVAEPEWSHCGDADWSGGTIMNCGYRVEIAATPEEIWPFIAGIGGKTGWYHADNLWRLRGMMDRMVGGVGLRRGRRHSFHISAGDALDFWRVLETAPPDRLRLLAEMKTPGEAILEFSVSAVRDRRTEIRILSRFLPRGLFGILYWYILYPFHEWVFFGMLKAIAAAVGKPVLKNPERFTPRLRSACRQP